MRTLAAAVLAALLATAAVAQDKPALVDGTVTKIDTKWNKVTVDHGPLENLDMPAMKMVFNVSDPAMLEGLSEGAKVRIAVERMNGKLTITEMERE